MQVLRNGWRIQKRCPIESIFFSKFFKAHAKHANFWLLEHLLESFDRQNVCIYWSSKFTSKDCLGIWQYKYEIGRYKLFPSCDSHGHLSWPWQHTKSITHNTCVLDIVCLISALWCVCVTRSLPITSCNCRWNYYCKSVSLATELFSSRLTINERKRDDSIFFFWRNNRKTAGRRRKKGRTKDPPLSLLFNPSMRSFFIALLPGKQCCFNVMTSL